MDLLWRRRKCWALWLASLAAFAHRAQAGLCPMDIIKLNKIDPQARPVSCYKHVVNCWRLCSRLSGAHSMQYCTAGC